MAGIKEYTTTRLNALLSRRDLSTRNTSLPVHREIFRRSKRKLTERRWIYRARCDKYLFAGQIAQLK